MKKLEYIEIQMTNGQEFYTIDFRNVSEFYESLSERKNYSNEIGKRKYVKFNSYRIGRNCDRNELTMREAGKVLIMTKHIVSAEERTLDAS